MQNSELKKSLINEGKYDFYNEIRSALFSAGWNTEQVSYYKGLSSEEVIACHQLQDAKKKQRRKVEQWLHYWVRRIESNHDATLFFCTFTFNDATLGKSFTARQKIIQRSLSQFGDYVSNVDYGASNGREHYHALLIMNLEDLNGLDWKRNKFGSRFLVDHPKLKDYTAKYGFICLEEVSDFKLNETTSRKMACYLAKLVNHSLKVRQSRLGYKRTSDYQLYRQAIKRVQHLSVAENKHFKGKIVTPEMLNLISQYTDTVPF